MNTPPAFNFSISFERTVRPREFGRDRVRWLARIASEPSRIFVGRSKAEALGMAVMWLADMTPPKSKGGAA